MTNYKHLCAKQASRIQELEATIALLKRESGFNDATDRIVADTHGYDPIPMASSTKIRFRTPQGLIIASLRENVLDLNADGHHVMHPRASNCAQFTVDKNYGRN